MRRVTGPCEDDIPNVIPSFTSALASTTFIVSLFIVTIKQNQFEIRKQLTVIPHSHSIPSEDFFFFDVALVSDPVWTLSWRLAAVPNDSIVSTVCVSSIGWTCVSRSDIRQVIAKVKQYSVNTRKENIPNISESSALAFPRASFPICASMSSSTDEMEDIGESIGRLAMLGLIVLIGVDIWTLSSALSWNSLEEGSACCSWESSTIWVCSMSDVMGNFLESWV